MLSKLVCPKCKGTNIDVQVVQETQGAKTTTKTRSKYKEKRHSFIWWLFMGWWWWIVELLLWIVAFIPMALLRIGRRKKYKGKATSTTTTKNIIEYKRVFVCKDCGHYWKG